MDLTNYANIQDGQRWTLSDEKINITAKEDVVEKSPLVEIFDQMVADIRQCVLKTVHEVESLLKLVKNVTVRFERLNQRIGLVAGWLGGNGNISEGKEAVHNSAYKKLHEMFFGTELEMDVVSEEYRDVLENLFLMLTDSRLAPQDVADNEQWMVANFPELEDVSSRQAFFARMRGAGMVSAVVYEAHLALSTGKKLLLAGDIENAHSCFAKGAALRDLSNQDSIELSAMEFFSRSLLKADKNFNNANRLQLEFAIHQISDDEFPDMVERLAKAGVKPMACLQIEELIAHGASVEETLGRMEVLRRDFSEMDKDEKTALSAKITLFKSLLRDPSTLTKGRMDEIRFDLDYAYEASKQPAIRAKLAEHNAPMMYLEGLEQIRAGNEEKALFLFRHAASMGLAAASEFANQVSVEESEQLLSSLSDSICLPFVSTMEEYYAVNPLPEALQKLSPGDKLNLFTLLEKLSPAEVTETLDELVAVADEDDLLAGTLASLPEKLATAKRNREIAAGEAFYFEKVAPYFDLQVCPDDGDCFYHGIGFGTGMDMMTVREDLAEFMVTNKQRLLELNDDVLSTLFSDDNELDMHIFLTSQKADGPEGWGSLAHAKLISWMYGIPVVLHSHHFEKPLAFDTDLNGYPLTDNAVHLLYNGVNHWNRVVPKDLRKSREGS